MIIFSPFILSWVGAVAGLTIGIPQLVKTLRTRSVRDLSLVSFALIVITCVCFLARSLVIQEHVMALHYGFILLVASAQIVLILRFRRGPE